MLDLLAVDEDMMALLLTHSDEVEEGRSRGVTEDKDEGEGKNERVINHDSGGGEVVPVRPRGGGKTTKTFTNPRRRDRIAAELLLEGYVARLSHALNEIIFMQQKMTSRANMANMVMTVQRNRIMRMNLHTSIAVSIVSFLNYLCIFTLKRCVVMTIIMMMMMMMVMMMMMMLSVCGAFRLCLLGLLVV